MPKPYLLAFASGLSYLVQYPVFAQVPPSIEWQRTLGGSDGESAASIQRTVDGGYIVAGVANSNDGDVSGNYGGPDMWVVKLDQIGEIQWQRCFGGSLFEGASEIEQTNDGGYIVIGTTASSDGQVVGNHGGPGDAWVVKLNGDGDVQWQRTIGGSAGDTGTSIQQTADGGYIMTGGTSSIDGDVVGNHGSVDFFINRIDAVGNLVWSRCYGGSEWEAAQSVKQTSDGGYVVAGNCSSTNGDVMGNHGGYDAWVVKLDAFGNLQWQRALGGSNWEASSEIIETGDGGYIVACSTESDDGDVTGHHGYRDFWLVKLDAGGSVLWQRTLGGSENDGALAMAVTVDDGYVVVGWTESDDGDVSGLHGWIDVWVVRLNSSGELQWQKTLGGTGIEEASSVWCDSAGVVFAGNTTSLDGDVAGNNGELDAWVVKLGFNDVGIPEHPRAPLHLFPNPSSGIVQVMVDDRLRGTESLVINDALGRELMRVAISSQSSTLNLQALPSGPYSITLYRERGALRKTIILE